MHWRRPPLQHPLAPVFAHAVESLCTALAPSSKRNYDIVVRSFLVYLGTKYPKITRLEQLRRDPHILGWMAHLSLDPSVIQKHLAGELTVGLYAINPETQCSKWVAIDADYEGAYRDLRTLKWELEQDGVHAVVEMSRRGAHLWILCERPLPARLCRTYIYSLALRLDVPIKGTFRQVDGIEVFPRQDEIGSSEYGNAIRGPLGIHRANMHRYWFEDAPSNLADQIAYLRSVKRLTAAELETFTQGVTVPESVCGRTAKDVAPPDVSHTGFQILQHVKVRFKRSGNYWTQCPSCARRGSASVISVDQIQEMKQNRLVAGFSLLRSLIWLRNSSESLSRLPDRNPTNADTWRFYAQCTDDSAGAGAGVDSSGEGRLLRELRDGLDLGPAEMRSLRVGANRGAGAFLLWSY